MDLFLTDTNIIAVYIFTCIDVNMGVHETFCNFSRCTTISTKVCKSFFWRCDLSASVCRSDIRLYLCVNADAQRIRQQQILYTA